MAVIDRHFYDASSLPWILASRPQQTENSEASPTPSGLVRVNRRGGERATCSEEQPDAFGSVVGERHR